MVTNDTKLYDSAVLSKDTWESYELCWLIVTIEKQRKTEMTNNRMFPQTN